MEAMLLANIVRNIFVRNNLRPVRNICSDLDMGQTPNRSKITTKLLTSPKVNMLKFGDVSFDLGFERGRMSATGYVAKISMLRLNIGSGKLSSCMLSIGRGPKAVQGKGGGCPPLPCSHLGPRPMLSMHELSLPEPMLSLSMLILATCPEQPPAGGGGRLLLALFGAPRCYAMIFWRPAKC